MQHLHYTWWDSFSLRWTWLALLQLSALGPSTHRELLHLTCTCPLSLTPIQIIALLWTGRPVRPLGHFTVLRDDTGLICHRKNLLDTLAVGTQNKACYWSKNPTFNKTKLHFHDIWKTNVFNIKLILNTRGKRYYYLQRCTNRLLNFSAGTNIADYSEWHLPIPIVKKKKPSQQMLWLHIYREPCHLVHCYNNRLKITTEPNYYIQLLLFSDIIIILK